MPTFGHLKRDYPIMEILRGWNPNEPFTRTAAYPVASGVTIYSGMLIYPAWNNTNNRLEWSIADKDVAGIHNLPIYIAQDDSSKEDVIEAGNLVGLSCAGQFEVQTCWFTTGQAYNEGVYLTIGDDGKVTPVTLADQNGATAGTTTAVPSNVVIVGQVTRAPGSSGDAAPYDVTTQSNVGINSSAVATNVITFNTMLMPSRVQGA